MVDVTDATFEAEILERSDQVPVVVDLWAEWCGPCKALGPILEKVIDATGGEVVLAKIDVDSNPRLQATFQAQSIPAVFAIHKRQVVAQFVGARPEAQVQAFVDALRPTETERELSALLAAGDEGSLRKALDLAPGHEAATVALAELLVGQGDADGALALLAKVPETSETRRVAALARTGGDHGALAGVEAKLDGLLDQVKEDPDARQEFLDLLELLGPDDPRTAPYRKALTARLF